TKEWKLMYQLRQQHRVRETLQCKANTKPCRYDMTTLHPTKYPWNCTEITETMLRTASRGPRTDSHVLQFLDRSCLLEVSQHRVVLGDLLSIKLKSILRHLLERGFAFVAQFRDITRPRQR